MWRGWAMAVVLGAWALAACGGDGDAADADADEVTAASTTTSTSTPNASTPPPTGNESADDADAPVVTQTNEAPTTSTTAATTTTTTTEPPSGLTLAPDGLGVVQFGADRETTLAALIDAIGAPTVVQEPFQDSSSTARAGASWPGLSLTFTGPVDGPLLFWGYEFGRVHAVDASGALTDGDPWVPVGWQTTTATSDGIAPATPVVDVAESHPEVYMPDCGRTPQAASLLRGAGSPGQLLFLEPAELGLFVRVATDGTIFSVGAQASPNPFSCDGG